MREGLEVRRRALRPISDHGVPQGVSRAAPSSAMTSGVIADAPPLGRAEAGAQAPRFEELIDGVRLGGFHRVILVLAFIGMIVDGYDLTVAGFAAPSLVKAWHISPNDVGLILSMSLAGVFFGSPLFGWIGDRHGRKVALVAANIVLGVASLACAATHDVATLAGLRALAGIGIGGVIPNLVSLVSEFAPRRFRSREVLRMLLGNSIGAGAPGLVSVLLVARFGWQAFFVIGGVAPLLIALVYALWLPESIKFLALHRPGDPRIARTMDRLGLRAGERAFVLDEPGAGRGRPGFGQIFQGRMRFITPLLWVAFVADLMVYYFIYGWTPLLLGMAGADPASAAKSMVLFAIGGAASGLALGSLVDRFGVRLLVGLFLAAMVIVTPLGLFARSPALDIVAFFAGFALLGLQYSLNAIAGGLYATACRSQGVGSALGIGRIGAVAGSLGGGALVAARLSVDHIYALALAPLAMAAVACVLILRIINKEA